MGERVAQTIENLQVPVGYTVAGAVGSTPVWLESVTNGLELVAVIVAIAVGVTTARFNIIRTRRLKEGK